MLRFCVYSLESYVAYIYLDRGGNLCLSKAGSTAASCALNIAILIILQLIVQIDRGVSRQ